ncbi:hypothetical protein [Prosthecobacter dejongeii]|uniref:FecR protein domain-containing protein n=1 Tax=Prosthecobacter dejongeii TaxID=48465 RepID=A0A7W8DQX5_9BACT|nr:hypothetical protein [Prosthecobacter dejongeii]MBB5038331.1 hypothetical protein [Prosthecobacter dejongeii]
MNLYFVDVVTRFRFALAICSASLIAACSAPQKSAVADPEVFNWSESQLRSRFPKAQNIGVVQLSGRKLKSQTSDTGDVEYLASGGALLVKKVEPPILAQASEIKVTPDAAILRGNQAMVKHNGRLITSESASTEITIDGVQVKVEGPHFIRDLATGKITPMAGATAPIAAIPEAVKAKIVNKPISQAPAKPLVRSVTVPLDAVKVPVPTPVSKTVAQKTNKRPLTNSQPTAKPTPPVDRKELLNLMRAPTE